MSETIFRILLTICFSIVAYPATLIATDCACPKVSCNESCEIQESLSFYTEKCDGGKRTRSCARPSCIPLDPLPASCPVAQKAPVEVKEERTPASVVTAPKALSEKTVAATVRLVYGDAWVERQAEHPNPGVEKSRVRKNAELFEGDTLETYPNGTLTFVWNNGNEVILPASSKLVLRQYKNSQESKKTLIDLIKGQVRSQVKEKLTSQTDSYEVRTPTAVAGVRGTDFVVVYNDTERLVTSVQTLTGKVMLASRDKAQEVAISGGESASFVVNDMSASVFSDEDIKSFVNMGFMTPVYKISNKELAQLKNTYGEVAMRTVAAEEANVCVEPSAKFNECSWTCVNNPKGEKTCRTDMPQVQCVRKRCNANGKWSDMNRLPSSFAGECPASGSRVQQCDY